MQSKKIRIIGGVWRSRLIKVIDAPGLRPTTDRVRETLFNWLGQNLDGLRCLDAFAGAGATPGLATGAGAMVEAPGLRSGRSVAAGLGLWRAG